MYKIVVSLAFLALIPTSFAAVISEAGSGFINYNDLLHSEEIFEDKINFVPYKSQLDDSIVLKNLKDILEEQDTIEKLYSNYKLAFDKNDETDEETSIAIFKNKLIEIATHNLEARNGKHTWEKGVNQFTDLSREAFKARYTGYVSGGLFQAFQNSSIPQIDPPTNSVAAPLSENWVTKNRVSSVKNQGSCNSCVMFASSGFMESLHAISKKSSAPDLSPQELLDCSQPNKDICSLGSMDAPVLDYIKKNGIALLKEYPQQSNYKKSPCNRGNKVSGGKLKSWSTLSGGENGLMNGVATNPISTGIHGVDDYHSGVYDGCPKNGGIDHAILVVGYGREGSSDYWLIKNSYGARWGDNGYLKLKRNGGNVCQIGNDIMITGVAA